MGKFSLLNADTVSFIELIGNGYFYKVPKYQRDYSWQVIGSKDPGSPTYTSKLSLNDENLVGLGNLFLLEKNLNKKAGSSSFPEKKKLYSQSEYELPKLLVAAYQEWNADMIKKHQQELAEYAAKIWKSDLVNE